MLFSITNFTLHQSLYNQDRNRNMSYDFILKLLILYYISQKHGINCCNQKRTEACEMLIAIDEPLYENFNRNFENLTKVVKLHVQELNNIFQKSVFKGEKYEKVYFRIKEIRFLSEFCAGCQLSKDVFLNEFSKVNTSMYCLAHLFTYRDFPNGITGYAYTPDAAKNYVGGICYKQNNAGFTTFLNHKVT